MFGELSNSFTEGGGFSDSGGVDEGGEVRVRVGGEFGRFAALQDLS